MRVAFVTTDNREEHKNYGARWPVFGMAPDAVLAGLASIKDLEVHVISCVQRPVEAPSKLAENIFYHALHVPKMGWMRTGYSGCICAARRLIASLQPDIVHGQGTERECGLIAAFSGRPNVITIHGNMARIARMQGAPPLSFHWFAARLEDFTLPRTDGVLCNSKHTERIVERRARKTWRVPNSLRPPFFANVPERTERSDPPRLLNVGVISPLKQQVKILEMAGALHAAGRRFEISFVGALDATTVYGAEFKRMLSEAQNVGYARYLGSLDLPTLIDTFDRSDALIHFPYEESFGLVVAEALARNLPVFGADVGGIPDIMSGVENARLIPGGDWRALGEAVGSWLNADAPSGRVTTAAAEIARRYSPQRVALMHLEIYRRLLGT